MPFFKKNDQKAFELFVNYKEARSLCEILEKVALKFSDLWAITDEYNNIQMTYGQLKKEVDYFAGGLQALGVKKGDFVSLFSENHGRWIVADQGILKCGAIAAVRGSNAPVDELDFIIYHSDSKGLVLRDDTTLEKLRPHLSGHKLDFIILLFVKDEVNRNGLSCPVYLYDEIIAMGKNKKYTPVEMNLDDNMALLYTSGTTGNPKGVLLTHRNIVYQITVAHQGFLSQPGEKTLQILPVWHAYEKVGQYYYFSRACHLHFTTLANLKNDLVKYKIDTMMSVPRIWEAMRHGIYQVLKQKSELGYNIFRFAITISMAYKESSMYLRRRITNKRIYSPLTSVMSFFTVIALCPLHKLFSATVYKKLKTVAGLNFRASISGGGALSMQDEYFYDAIGVNLRVGYGLTETSPVITLRNVTQKNFLGCAGQAVQGTELKIVDPHNFRELKKFQKGLVLARGPQIMKGYYKDPEATRAIIDKDGWLNTGDLGWLTNEKNLVLVGRLKETIVLSTGENVEPAPIEEVCLNSPYIEQIVLVGQDKSGVGALVIPSQGALEKCGLKIDDLQKQKESSIQNQALRELIKRELSTCIKNKPKLRPFERIIKFELLKETFSMDNGLLTQSAKVKRNTVFEKYKDLITKMYK